MQDYSFAARTKAMREFINKEYLRYKRDLSVKPLPDETVIPDKISVTINSENSTTIQAAKEIKKFLENCMGIDVCEEKSENNFEINLNLEKASFPFDSLNHECEKFIINVEKNNIRISSKFTRGIMQGVQYLKHIMADRKAPYIITGQIEKTPVFMPRISNSIFINAHQDFADLEQFEEDYLSLMSYFGVNGIHLHVSLWDFCKNKVIPELNSDQFEKNISQLNDVINRLNKFGIDVYLYVGNRKFPGEHEIFKSHPNIKGASSRGLPEIPPKYVLCGNNEKVLSCYGEAFTNLVKAAPNLAGVIIIVGGEGFHHCYTRPEGKDGGYTNCKKCHDIEPSESIANLTNTIAASIKKVSENTAVFAWPYGAFTWSGKDRWQKKWLNLLSKDIMVCSNFASGGIDKFTNEDIILYDYNIKSAEASEIFSLQAAECQKLGKKIYCKIETNTTPSVFFMPYFPVHFRWHKRYREMVKENVAGFIGQWRFFGMNGSLPEELQYHATWNNELSAEDCLRIISRRDFNIDENKISKAIEGWKLISESWDYFPFSALTSGERDFYMRGPLYLGPAHPLIFNVQNRYNLSESFYPLRGDIGEGATPEQIEELKKNAMPRYISELMFIYPFGIDKYLELLEKSMGVWDKGVSLLTEAFGEDPTLRAKMELGICRIFGIHLRTIYNVARFYSTKEKMFLNHGERNSYKENFDKLYEILKDEIANASEAIPILEDDNRIGYGHCYGLVYNALMVREKISQCLYVLETELPLLDTNIRFHLWNEF